MNEKQEKSSRRLRELCERAAKEQDTTRLIELVKEIIDTYDGQQGVVDKKAGDRPQSEA